MSISTSVTRDDIDRFGYRTLADILRADQKLKSTYAILLTAHDTRDDILHGLDVSDHSEAEFSHGICPPCLERVSREYES